MVFVFLVVDIINIIIFIICHDNDDHNKNKTILVIKIS